MPPKRQKGIVQVVTRVPKESQMSHQPVTSQFFARRCAIIGKSSVCYVPAISPPSISYQPVVSQSLSHQPVPDRRLSVINQSSVPPPLPLSHSSVIRSSPPAFAPSTVSHQSSTPLTTAPDGARSDPRRCIAIDFLYPHAAPRAAPADRNVQISFRDNPP